jgi:hypothetical protein
MLTTLGVKAVDALPVIWKPVAVAHVGCVTVPAVGAAGVAGCALTTILMIPGDVHPAALVCESIGT